MVKSVMWAQANKQANKQTNKQTSSKSRGTKHPHTKEDELNIATRHFGIQSINPGDDVDAQTYLDVFERMDENPEGESCFLQKTGAVGDNIQRRRHDAAT